MSRYVLALVFVFAVSPLLHCTFTAKRLPAAGPAATPAAAPQAAAEDAPQPAPSASAAPTDHPGMTADQEKLLAEAKLAAKRPCDDIAVSACQTACDGGDTTACEQLGEMYMNGDRVPRDLAHGGRLLQGACAKGSIKACYMHGASFQVLDPPAGIASLKKACAADSMWSAVACMMLLQMVDRGSYTPPRDELVSLAHRVCDQERTSKTSVSHGACGRLKDLGESPP